ncbi:MAG: pyridoxal phosphate-dependent aminotransferase [Candidatus Dormibacteria bacterium]
MPAITRLSPTLAVNQAIRQAQRDGRDIVHLAFGEAGLPVHPLLAEHLQAGIPSNAYGPVAGEEAVRSAAAGYLTRRGIQASAGDVVITPGSKAALFALITALPGDLVLPTPAWVSYAAHAALAGKRVVSAPIPEEAGGIPDPELLPRVLAAARKSGARPGILLVTIPDNPTGTVASPELVRWVCEIAADEELVVISDEIYRDLAYDPTAVLSPAAVIPDLTYVTSGLSKAWALGGWRVGFLKAPSTASGRSIVESVTAIGSEIWSCVASPMSEVAKVAFSEPDELTAFVADSRELHRTVSLAVHERFVQAGGIASRTPQAAFYQYPDFGARRGSLAASGIHTSDELAEAMLSTYGIGVLPGSAFGVDPAELQVRVSTSLLYGKSSSERWETLAASRQGRALEVPRIADALERITGCLAALGADR